MSREHVRKPTVVVGLDFGTHSTKIVARLRGQPLALCGVPRPAAPGFQPIAIPSLVRLDGRKLYFGAKASTHPNGALYRFLKVRLLGLEAEAQLDVYPNGPPPDLLVAAFLGYLICQVRNLVTSQFGADSRVLLNVGAPMDRECDSSLKERYLHLVNAAWNVEGTISQGCDVADVASRLEPLMTAAYEDAAERPYEVLPETIAPVVSMQQDPSLEEGIYQVIDVGAGTTEATVCLMRRVNGETKITCYCDQTVSVGAERLAIDQEKGSNASLRELVRLRKSTWHRAYQSEMRSVAARTKWTKLHTMLSGGGGLRDDVVKHINECLPPSSVFGGDQYVQCATHRHVPNEIAGLRGMLCDSSFLAVANGLSIERQLWPEWYSPDSVDSLEGTPPIPKPSPHWCQ